jgi:hypothetical protein
MYYTGGLTLGIFSSGGNSIGPMGNGKGGAGVLDPSQARPDVKALGQQAGAKQ